MTVTGSKGWQCSVEATSVSSGFVQLTSWNMEEELQSFAVTPEYIPEKLGMKLPHLSPPPPPPHTHTLLRLESEKSSCQQRNAMNGMGCIGEVGQTGKAEGKCGRSVHKPMGPPPPTTTTSTSRFLQGANRHNILPRS